MQKIDKDIENLYQKLEKVRQGILPKVKNLSLSFKSHLNNMLQDLNSQLRTNMDYWDTEEPFEVRKEGFFTDDYYVEYREVSYYKYSDYGLEKAHDKVYEDFHKYFDQFNQSMVSTLEKYHEEINTLLDQFGNDQEDALDDIDFTMDLHKQYFFNNSEDLHDYVEKKSLWNGYFYSGMYCGGVYSLNLKAYLMKYKNKPSYADLKKELSLYLPLDKLVEMIDEYPNQFNKSSQETLASSLRFFKYYIPSLSSDLDDEIEEFKNALKMILSQ